MNREDAEEAMESVSETDPFNVGRLLMMRWGKNVKKIVKRGTGGGREIAPMLRKAPLVLGSESAAVPLPDPEEEHHLGDPPRIIEMKPDASTSHDTRSISNAASYDRSIHGEDAIVVEMPNDNRFQFISTVASFVAKDGSSLERKLIETESGNPLFNFLTLENASSLQRKEHIFYRWRVYSFCQGDRHSGWRVEPFVMFHPHGRYWIPPAMDKVAARLERQDFRDRKDSINQQKKERRRVICKREYLTGRQLELARDGRRKANRRGRKGEAVAKLQEDEIHQFFTLVHTRLSSSRETICAAMAFCFEKSDFSKEIAELLLQALLETGPTVTVEMRISRLYLLSDILFNSQQPGVRNAFLYRSAIEKMAPDIFTSLGEHGDGKIGRMTLNKLRIAVSSVLGAWTEWSAYNPTFMDELEARFEGREIQIAIQHEAQDEEVEENNQIKEEAKKEEPAEIITDKPRGDWTEVTENADDSDEMQDGGAKKTDFSNVDGGSISIDGEAVEDGNVDGDSISIDGEAVEDGNVDGDSISIDGEAVEDCSIDGEAVDDGQILDREPDDGQADCGEAASTRVELPSAGNDVDGDPIDGNEIGDADLDGEPL
jgi:U2-associated protein SR140